MYLSIDPGLFAMCKIKALELCTGYAKHERDQKKTG